MGLFRRKKESKGANKKFVIAVEIIVAVLLFLSLLGIKWLYYNIEKEDVIIKLDNQVVSDLSFVDFEADYTKEDVSISVSVINYTEADIDIKNIRIKLYASDNNLISQIDVPNVGTLSSNQEHVIKNKVNLDTKIAFVQYEVE